MMTELKPPFDVKNSDDILTTEYPPVVWAIPDLLPCGLTILAGRPKLGKSWLALQIAQAVSAGGRVFGKQVEQGRVLYLALEDGERRLQDRMRQQGWTVGLAKLCDFVTMKNFVRQVGYIGRGGEDKIARAIKECGYHLTIIDTFSRAIGPGKDQDSVSEMTSVLGPLQSAAQENNFGFLILDHHRKGDGGKPDEICDILGSTAKGGVADSIWGFYRTGGRGSPTTLKITGRDIKEEYELSLRMDRLTACWQLAEGGKTLTDKQSLAMQIVKEIGGKCTLKEYASSLARKIGTEVTDSFRGACYQSLQSLVNAEALDYDGSVYSIPAVGA